MTLVSSVLFFLSSLVFGLTHLALRQRRRISISDYFSAFLLLQFGPIILFNITGVDNYISPSTSATNNLLISLSVMYLALSVGYVLSRFVPVGRYQGGVDFQSFPKNKLRSFQIYIIVSMVIISSIFLAHSDVRSYFTEAIDLVFVRFENELYTNIRRHRYADSFIIFQVMGRTRYSLIAAIYVLFLATWLHAGRSLIVGISIGYLFFSVTAASLSKLPWVYFFVYASLVSFHLKQNVGNFAISKKHVILLLSSFIFAFFILILLYIIQYPNIFGFDNFFSGPASLAFYRVFQILYDVLLRYYEVYPEILPHTGGASSRVLSAIFGLTFRNPDHEVPNVLLNAFNTSNPTLFIGAAWADFGMAGVMVMSFLVGFYVKILDAVAGYIRAPFIRSSYEAVCGLNSLFFVQLAAPTALLTYGLGLFPIFFLSVDYMFFAQVSPKGSNQVSSQRAR